MRHLPTRASALSVVAAVGLAAGCADEPTSPPEPAAARPGIPASVADRSAVGSAVADATRRVLPSLVSLERLTNKAELGDQLEAIAASLQRNDARALERDILRAERALARVAAKEVGADASELDAIRIAIAEVKRLVAQGETSVGDATTTPARSKP
jgi:hypothetical protein